MSRATKRKYVTKEVIEDFIELGDDQEIVKVLGGRGNNLHEVENGTGEQYLVSMPTKFRRTVWIKRGDFIVVEPISEGDKVKAEIIHILYPKQIKTLKEESKWPLKFQDKTKLADSHDSNKFRQRSGNETGDSNDNTDSDNDSDLFTNTNRPPPLYNNHSSSSSEDD